MNHADSLLAGSTTQPTLYACGKNARCVRRSVALKNAPSPGWL
jgi:hypothetical protein